MANKPVAHHEQEATPPAEQRNPLAELRTHVNQLFDEAWRGFPSAQFPSFGRVFGELSPSADLSESDKEIQATIELPGMDEKDIEVLLTDDRLTIKGEKKNEREEKEKDYHVIERSYGSFQRSFTLPAEVDAAKTSAVFKNGVLTVTIPKSASAKAAVRKIEVKSK
jgi:HSP20 family protein